jgi:hypothetical protein
VQTLIKEIEGGTLEGLEMWQHWFEGDPAQAPLKAPDSLKGPPPQPEH